MNQNRDTKTRNSISEKTIIQIAKPDGWHILLTAVVAAYVCAARRGRIAVP